MSRLSFQDRVKALNLGLTVSGDFNTGQVSVTGGQRTFVFESVEQASQALDLANYAVFNTLHKMTAGSITRRPAAGVEACGCNRKPTEREVEQAFIDLREARDAAGLRVMLLGSGDSPLERARSGLLALAEKSLDEPNAANLRNLALLARAYHLALEYSA